MNLSEKRLLIVVQAVDLDDPLMGFFHEWLLEAAKQFSLITVLALRVGRYALPSHVRVHSLRPRGSRSRLRAAWTMWSMSWQLRHEYSAVFLRGDAQYVVLTGWLWRLLGKRIVLWYAHYKVNGWVWPASLIAHTITASVPAALSHPWVHAEYIGQNIPHERFYQAPIETKTSELRMLTLGRVVRIKGIKECVEAFIESGVAPQSTLTIVGPRSDAAYEAELTGIMARYPTVTWGPALIPYDQLPDQLRTYDILLNAYPASLDKVIIESMMSGVIPIVTTEGLRSCLPAELHWLIAPDQASRAAAMQRISALSIEERYALGQRLRHLAIEHHSLQGQLKRLQMICFPSSSS